MFAKFEGGKPVTAEGVVEEVTQEFVKVSCKDEDGGSRTCSFRRNPGRTSGWGTGASKFWRLGAEARKKYCHPDVPSGRR